MVASLRAELTSALQRQAAELAERAAGEREAAVRQATELVRKENQDQLDQVRRSANEQMEAAKRAIQAESQARIRAEAQVEDVRRIGRTQVDEAQRAMADRVSALTRELDESRREIAARRTELDSAKGASAASLTDLVRGIHAVDEAQSLSAVFDRLIDSAQHHSKGASVLIVQGDDLRAWGNADNTRVNERGKSVALSAAFERRRVESETAIAFPINVSGEVIAVLYAEVDDALSPQRRISKDILDTLTRHAGRVLETITVQQAAGLRPVRLETSAGRSGYPMGERLS